jgi:hypothetical protein
VRAERLRELGVEVDLVATESPEVRGYDVAHVFGVFYPERAARQIAAVRAAGVPLVLSPIWLVALKGLPDCEERPDHDEADNRERSRDDRSARLRERGIRARTDRARGCAVPVGSITGARDAGERHQRSKCGRDPGCCLLQVRDGSDFLREECEACDHEAEPDECQRRSHVREEGAFVRERVGRARLNVHVRTSLLLGAGFEDDAGVARRVELRDDDVDVGG